MKNIVSMHQIHSNNVVFVDSKNIGEEIQNCDGLVTDEPNLQLSVHVADCLPVFLYSPTTNSIGVIHVGWRGLDNGIIEKAIEKMSVEFNADPKDLNVFIGPHICQKHYKVGNEFITRFKDYKSAFKRVGKCIYFDLGKVARLQMQNLGITKITIDKTCTFENHNLDSYRRHDMERNTHYLFQIP